MNVLELSYRCDDSPGRDDHIHRNISYDFYMRSMDRFAVESLFGRHNFPDDVILQVISGGQTGVDRAAMDVAMKLQMATGGWCPAGRRVEDGFIPEQYLLKETGARNYATRTRCNVRDTDGTLIVNLGELDGGTLKTVEHAGKIGKPCLVVQLDDPGHPMPVAIKSWLLKNSIRTLNVAGPRESKRPGIYRQSADFFTRTVRTMSCDFCQGPQRLDFPKNDM